MKKIEQKTIYNKWINKITCAYKKDIWTDKNKESHVSAKRTEQREKYLFPGLPNDEVILIECPPDVLAIEFEDTREKNNEYIEETKKNATKLGLQWCVADHGGKSPYFYAFNLEGLPEKQEKQAKEIITLKIIPKKAEKFLDKTNLGSTLIPIIEQPHWKTKYNGAIHKIIEGTPPLQQKNPVHHLIIPKESMANSGRKKTNYFVTKVLEKTTLTQEMIDLGFELTHNPTKCLWHDSQKGKNFSYDENKHVWHCFHCSKGGGVIQLIQEHYKISFAESVKRLCQKHKINILHINKTEELTPEEKVYFKQLFNLDPKKATNDLAKYIIDTHKVITFEDNEESYYYEKGIYKPGGEIIIKKIVQEIIQEEARNGVCSEVIGQVKRMSYVNRNIFEKTPINLLCIENGILDIHTKELKEHTHDLYFLNKIPIKYVPGIDCPLIKKFISEVVIEKHIKTIQEMIGFCLYKKYKINKAFMLTGGGSNGKSTLIGLIRVFLGIENVSSRSLQELEFDKFAMADLFGKLANLYSEIPKKSMISTEKFKIATGGVDVITAQEKFKNTFQFVNYAKYIFSANQVPKTYDDTDAYYRRWVIINFPNQFTEGKEDVHLFEKITSHEELTGLLNWVLEGLHDLLNRGFFYDNQKIQDIKINYTRLSDSSRTFIMDCLEQNHMSVLRKEEIYDSYASFCRLNNLIIDSDRLFFKILYKEKDIKEFRPTIDGKRERCIQGISINKDINISNNYILSNKPDLSNKNLLIKDFEKSRNSVENQDNDINRNHMDILVKVDGTHKPTTFSGLIPENITKSGITPESELNKQTPWGVGDTQTPESLALTLEYLDNLDDKQPNKDWILQNFGENLLKKAFERGLVYEPVKGVIKITK